MRALPAAAILGVMVSFVGNAMAAAPNPGLGDRVTWVAGEKLEYDISWGPLTAAHASYTAQVPAARPDCREFLFALETKGSTHVMYPINANGRSLVQVKPWRFLEMEDQRMQARKPRDISLRADYAAHTVTRLDRIAGKTETKPFSGESLGELISVFYGLRTVAWTEGEKRTFVVFDGEKLQDAEAVFVGREKITMSDGPRPTRLVKVRPVYNDPKKDAQGLGTSIWFSDDDRQVPLRGEMKLKFGKLKIRLVDNPPVSGK